MEDETSEQLSTVYLLPPWLPQSYFLDTKILGLASGPHVALIYATSALNSNKINAKILFSSHFHLFILLAIFPPVIWGSRNGPICSCVECDLSSSTKLQNLIDMSLLFLFSVSHFRH